MVKALSTVAKRIPTFPTEIKVRAMSCLECLINAEDNDNRVSTITEKWFKVIDSNPMDFLLTYCRNPFVELRIAGFGILNSVSKQQWGQNTIRGTPGTLFIFYKYTNGNLIMIFRFGGILNGPSNRS